MSSDPRPAPDMSMDGNEVRIKIFQDGEARKDLSSEVLDQLSALRQDLTAMRQAQGNGSERPANVKCSLISYDIDSAPQLARAVSEIKSRVMPCAENWRDFECTNTLTVCIQNLYLTMQGRWQVTIGETQVFDSELDSLVLSLGKVVDMAMAFDGDPDATWITVPIHRLALEMLHVISRCFLSDAAEFKSVREDLLRRLQALKVLKKNDFCVTVLAEIAGSLSDMLQEHLKKGGTALANTIVGGVKSFLMMKVDGQLIEGITQGLHCAFEMYKHYKANDQFEILRQLCPFPEAGRGYDVMKLSCNEMRAAEGNWLLSSLYVNNTMKVALSALSGLLKKESRPEDKTAALEVLTACLSGDFEVDGILSVYKKLNGKKRSNHLYMNRLFDGSQLCTSLRQLMQECLGELMEGAQYFGTAKLKNIVDAQNIDPGRYPKQYLQAVDSARKALNTAKDNFIFLQDRLTKSKEHMLGFASALDMVLAYGSMFPSKVAQMPAKELDTVCERILESFEFYDDESDSGNPIDKICNAVKCRAEILGRGGELDLKEEYCKMATKLELSVKELIDTNLEWSTKLKLPKCSCCALSVRVSMLRSRLLSVRACFRKFNKFYKILKNTAQFGEKHWLNSLGGYDDFSAPQKLLHISSDNIEEVLLYCDFLETVLSRVKCCSSRIIPKTEYKANKDPHVDESRPGGGKGHKRSKSGRLFGDLFGCASREAQMSMISDLPPTSDPLEHPELDALLETVPSQSTSSGGSFNAPIVCMLNKMLETGTALKNRCVDSGLVAAGDKPPSENAESEGAAADQAPKPSEPSAVSGSCIDLFSVFLENINKNDDSFTRGFSCGGDRTCSDDDCFMHACKAVITEIVDATSDIPTVLVENLVDYLKESGIVQSFQRAAEAYTISIPAADVVTQLTAAVDVSFLSVHMSKFLFTRLVTDSFSTLDKAMEAGWQALFNVEEGFNKVQPMKILRKLIYECSTVFKRIERNKEFFTTSSIYLKFGAFALAKASRAFDETADTAFRLGPDEYVVEKAMDTVKTQLSAAVTRLGGMDEIGWMQSIAGLWGSFLGNSFAMSLVRDGVKTLFGPGTKPEMVEEASVAAMVEVEVYIRSVLMKKSHLPGNVADALQKLVDEIAIQTTYAHASSGNKKVQQIFKQDNYRGLMQEAVAKSWYHVEGKIILGYESDLLELENVKKELNDMTAVNVETGVVTIANKDVDICQRLAFYDAVPTIIKANDIESRINATAATCDILMSSSGGVAGRAAEIKTRLRHIKKDVVASKRISESLVEIMDPRRITPESSYILGDNTQDIRYNPGVFLMDPGGKYYGADTKKSHHHYHHMTRVVYDSSIDDGFMNTNVRLGKIEKGLNNLREIFANKISDLSDLRTSTGTSFELVLKLLDDLAKKEGADVTLRPVIEALEKKYEELRGLFDRMFEMQKTTGPALALVNAYIAKIQSSLSEAISGASGPSLLHNMKALDNIKIVVEKIADLPSPAASFEQVLKLLDDLAKKEGADVTLRPVIEALEKKYEELRGLFDRMFEMQKTTGPAFELVNAYIAKIQSSLSEAISGASGPSLLHNMKALDNIKIVVEKIADLPPPAIGIDELNSLCDKLDTLDSGVKAVVSSSTEPCVSDNRKKLDDLKVSLTQLVDAPRWVNDLSPVISRLDAIQKSIDDRGSPDESIPLSGDPLDVGRELRDVKSTLAEVLGKLDADRSGEARIPDIDRPLAAEATDMSGIMDALMEILELMKPEEKKKAGCWPWSRKGSAAVADVRQPRTDLSSVGSRLDAIQKALAAISQDDAMKPFGNDIDLTEMTQSVEYIRQKIDDRGTSGVPRDHQDLEDSYDFSGLCRRLDAVENALLKKPADTDVSVIIARLQDIQNILGISTGSGVGTTEIAKNVSDIQAKISTLTSLAGVDLRSIVDGLSEIKELLPRPKRKKAPCGDSTDVYDPSQLSSPVPRPPDDNSAKLVKLQEKLESIEKQLSGIIQTDGDIISTRDVHAFMIEVKNMVSNIPASTSAGESDFKSILDSIYEAIDDIDKNSGIDGGDSTKLDDSVVHGTIRKRLKEIKISIDESKNMWLNNKISVDALYDIVRDISQSISSLPTGGAGNPEVLDKLEKINKRLDSLVQNPVAEAMDVGTELRDVKSTLAEILEKLDADRGEQRLIPDVDRSFAAAASAPGNGSHGQVDLSGVIRKLDDLRKLVKNSGERATPADISPVISRLDAIQKSIDDRGSPDESIPLSGDPLDVGRELRDVKSTLAEVLEKLDANRSGEALIPDVDGPLASTAAVPGNGTQGQVDLSGVIRKLDDLRKLVKSNGSKEADKAKEQPLSDIKTIVLAIQRRLDSNVPDIIGGGDVPGPDGIGEIKGTLATIEQKIDSLFFLASSTEDSNPTKVVEKVDKGEKDGRGDNAQFPADMATIPTKLSAISSQLAKLESKIFSEQGTGGSSDSTVLNEHLATMKQAFIDMSAMINYDESFTDINDQLEHLKKLLGDNGAFPDHIAAEIKSINTEIEEIREFLMKLSNRLDGKQGTDVPKAEDGTGRETPPIGDRNDSEKWAKGDSLKINTDANSPSRRPKTGGSSRNRNKTSLSREKMRSDDSLSELNLPSDQGKGFGFGKSKRFERSNTRKNFLEMMNAKLG